MFIWSTGMPLFAVIFFAVASIFVFWCFVRAVRGHGWDVTCCGDSAAGPESGEYERLGPWRCTRSRCRTMNTSRARFCRMCGSPRSL